MALKELRLLRFDVDTVDEDNPVSVQDIDLTLIPGPIDRAKIVSKLNLPEDSIIKVYFEGQLIPWSMLSGPESECESVEIHVFRPHQNVKAQSSEARMNSDLLILEKVKQLESRIASLEAVADPELLAAKTDQDLQVLTKQISFLSKRVELAENTEWSKKP